MGARFWLFAVVVAAGGCSLLAPSDDELLGGSRDGGSAAAGGKGGNAGDASVESGPDASGGAAGSTSGGAGGTAGCGAGTSACNGGCVDTNTDPNNCGACNQTCSTGQSCIGGHCACSGSDTLCSGQCVNTQTDVNNCGSCGNPCASGVPCVSGVCTPNCSPPALEFLIDVSASMSQAFGGNGTRLDAVAASVTSFVQSAGSSGLVVGLQYFSQGTASTQCTVATYQNPPVQLAPLPGSVSVTIAQWFAQATANGQTPTAAAIQGTINYVAADQTVTSSAKRAIVMLTDGIPTGCAPDLISDVSNAAANGKNGTPSVLTYVVTIAGSIAEMDQVAAAGGTTAAYPAATPTDIDNALVSIRSLIACP